MCQAQPHRPSWLGEGYCDNQQGGPAEGGGEHQSVSAGPGELHQRPGREQGEGGGERGREVAMEEGGGGGIGKEGGTYIGE